MPYVRGIIRTRDSELIQRKQEMNTVRKKRNSEHKTLRADSKDSGIECRTLRNYKDKRFKVNSKNSGSYYGVLEKL